MVVEIIIIMFSNSAVSIQTAYTRQLKCYPFFKYVMCTNDVRLQQTQGIHFNRNNGGFPRLHNWCVCGVKVAVTHAGILYDVYIKCWGS